MDIGRRTARHNDRPIAGRLRIIERCFCNFIFIFPLTVILAVCSWALWVLVWLISLSYLRSVLGVLISCFCILLYGMTLYCYLLTVFTPPGSPDDPTSDYSLLSTAEAANRLTVKENGRERYCQKCHILKPDRAHHCSICNKCILKMDHHCPWIGSCVGYRNHKYFLLFLFYLTVYCLGSCVLATCTFFIWVATATYV